MTGRLLDISTMPFDQSYTCKDGTVINFYDVFHQYRRMIEMQMQDGLIKQKDSFGFAMAHPQWHDDREDYGIWTDEDVWDKPEKFVWFVAGWGPECDRYIANAIRKLRPLLRLYVGRHHGGTLGIKLFGGEGFQDKVDLKNEPEGTFSWGDFPRGGAVYAQLGPLVLPVAVSALSETEDDSMAGLIAKVGYGQRILRGDGLLEPA